MICGSENMVIVPPGGNYFELHEGWVLETLICY